MICSFRMKNSFLSKYFIICMSIIAFFFFIIQLHVDIINSIEQIPWKANNHWVYQEFPMCNLMVHYHIHKSPSLDPILSQETVILILYFCIMDFNILWTMRRSPLSLQVFQPKLRCASNPPISSSQPILLVFDKAYKL
jgi:hypothetical protein